MDEKCGWVVFIKGLQTLDALRSNPHFQEFVARVGFPAE
jgi:hypothetical protein